ncbi:biotin/lipoyl-containing protein [Sediminicola sp. YIK13]|uniref:biotin/lipoyl-containing protein n=1 Tax=Sediminicola sp. YIK13 TaxID=1453352 RepID=UPI0009E7B447|nr:biotin/lipoyl-containing protein [Sediminicola sp. YIK13]
MNDLKSNPNFRSKDEIDKNGPNSNSVSDFKLDKGEVQTIFTPELGNQKGLTLSKWFYKSGDIVKSGDIICVIENEDITMEFESVFNGRIISTCRLNEKLTSSTELFKIEGI